MSCGALLAQNPNAPEPPMMGVHWARGVNAAGGHTSGSPQMTYHGGTIMPNSTTVPIFWGTNWQNSSFSGDKITGLQYFYQGEGGSSYADSVDEYGDSTGAQVTSASTYFATLMDSSAVNTNGQRTGPILSEVCKVLTANGVGPQTNGYYPVYTDEPRGHAGFCAWHSWGTCNGVLIQFAFFFSLDGDPGCDPQDTSNLHSQGLAALANVSGHELSEARSDPHGNAWYDSSGAENADKCAWTFGTPLVNFTNGTQWKIQGNWSNAAYAAGTGYPNSSGQKGCIE